MEGGEQKVQLFLDAVPKDDIPITAKSLTIKTTNAAGSRGGSDWSIPSSPSPPSSAFVSALQSPYISPRVAEPPPLRHRESPKVSNAAQAGAPSPASRTDGFRSEDTDAPTSASRTPPSERYDSRAIDLLRSSDGGGGVPAPRVSFSFPLPRVSLTRGAVASPMSNGKLRSCDVYIGFHGQGARYSGAHSHEVADRIICSAAFGIVVVTVSSFLNPFVLEEIRFFAQKRNLVPILFDTRVSDIAGLFDGKPEDKERMEAFEGLMRCHELKLETDESSWRRCVSRVVTVLQWKLGRGTIGQKETDDGLPFPRNRHFVGREKELAEIEGMFFGCAGDVEDLECPRSTMPNCETSGVSDGFADKDSDVVTISNGEFSSFELPKCKQPMLETLVDLAIEPPSVKGRSLQKERSKHRKSRFRCDSKDHANGNVICISGISGIGKTELALEFAYRYSQRYKMVLWIGGEARYLRQNILNLSRYLGLDISADAEKEHGRIRSFEEQELDAFQRVKRELFRDVPYLLIIDNLESERDWWEGKDMQDFIPRSTGASHVIVTTQLQRVMNLEPMHLPQLSFHDAMVLIKGKKKKDYPPDELEVLKKFDEQLGRLSFGLWLVGSLLSELMIDPGVLFEAIERVSLNENMIVLSSSDDNLWQNNLFLIKVLVFCFALMDQVKGGSLALRMITVGSWLAPSPISSTLLAAMASKLPTKANSLQLWSASLKTVFLCGTHCFLPPQARKAEVQSAHLLVKLGLARKTIQRAGCWIQLHPIVQLFSKISGSLTSASASVTGVVRTGNMSMYSDHMWASAFLLFGFKSEPPVVQLKAVDLVLFIKKIALPLAIQAFMTFSRCSSALELLKVCTNILEDAEKLIASRLQDMKQGSLCWKKKLQADNHVDEFIWHEMTLLKATLLETRAKLLMRGGLFDSAEELCRTCISIRTVMLGHDHAQTLAAQETLAKVVRYRSKI
ncbi:hypothetical protein ACQ4PT_032392 [Festuca glaucescens]